MKTIRIKKANNIKEKMIGFIGKQESYPLLIETHFGIHTFGVKFPIDVLVLDNLHKVISLRENLKPNRIFLWNIKHNKVLELPQKTIKEKNLKVGDIIKIILE
ncbi:MAG: hypothetical protein A2857_05680 [Candidatus Levybacteria bacterium RIFCSPHIGHO2_01_FULL_36_15]|nr:MAG: hypothetical protein A2857_05680 [Candidatus Levybacteria bacterium RIFCSPHIGHO2_01_FULL_36_15]OGH38391.1 MAG: hypothetical protein A2905_00480 [Candidatus Levybacteria bacterium RIFCSPLOWO2_01_FULL_36_10]